MNKPLPGSEQRSKDLESDRREGVRARYGS